MATREIKVNVKRESRPKLKTRQFSTLHIEIFDQILISGKTNLELNAQFGYTRKSHSIVDHSRKVMYKLLVLENLKASKNIDLIINPRKYKLWWKLLLEKHRSTLIQKAITPLFYEPSPFHNQKLNWLLLNNIKNQITGLGNEHHKKL